MIRVNSRKFLQTFHDKLLTKNLGTEHESGGHFQVDFFDETPTRKLSETPSSFKPFDAFISEHRESAKKSVLVQVKSADSADDLISYCHRNFAKPKSLQFHSNSSEDSTENFFLVEFDSKDILDEVLQAHARHREDLQTFFPVISPFVWFAKDSSSKRSSDSSARLAQNLHVPIYLAKDDKPVHAILNKNS